jgi:hypothetical protein
VTKEHNARLAAATNPIAHCPERRREERMPPLEHNHARVVRQHRVGGAPPGERIDGIDYALGLDRQGRSTLVELGSAGKEKSGVEAGEADDVNVMRAGHFARQHGREVADSTAIGVGRTNQADPHAAPGGAVWWGAAAPGRSYCLNA